MAHSIRLLIMCWITLGAVFLSSKSYGSNVAIAGKISPDVKIEAILTYEATRDSRFCDEPLIFPIPLQPEFNQNAAPARLFTFWGIPKTRVKKYKGKIQNGYYEIAFDPEWGNKRFCKWSLQSLELKITSLNLRNPDRSKVYGIVYFPVAEEQEKIPGIIRLSSIKRLICAIEDVDPDNFPGERKFVCKSGNLSLFVVDPSVLKHKSIVLDFVF